MEEIKYWSLMEDVRENAKNVVIDAAINVEIVIFVRVKLLLMVPTDALVDAMVLVVLVVAEAAVVAVEVDGVGTMAEMDGEVAAEAIGKVGIGLIKSMDNNINSHKS